MQLGFLKTVVVLLGGRERFVEHAVRVREAPGLRVCVAQHAEVVRDPQSRARGAEGLQPLEQKRKRVVDPALQEHPGALVEYAQCLPELKAVLGRDGDLLLRRSLNLGSDAAVMIETRREVDRMRRAEGMADRAGELTSFPVHLHGLVRVAKVPQRQCEIAPMGDARVVTRGGHPQLRALPVVVEARPRFSWYARASANSAR